MSTTIEAVYAKLSDVSERSILSTLVEGIPLPMLPSTLRKEDSLPGRLLRPIKLNPLKIRRTMTLLDALQIKPSASDGAARRAPLQ